jgi:2,4-dienoyl-CoA reductase-like NADH-dependent reductase (Old Yellow Enzyme family)
VELLRRIEKYLRRSGTPATRFGREAVHDPRFVLDLRKGREPRRATVARVQHFLDGRENGAAQ